jgi:hypothetical protein
VGGRKQFPKLEQTRGRVYSFECDCKWLYLKWRPRVAVEPLGYGPFLTRTWWTTATSQEYDWKKGQTLSISESFFRTLYNVVALRGVNVKSGSVRKANMAVMLPCAIALLNGVAFAKPPLASITGTVQDSSEVAISGASLIAISEETGLARTTQTESDGHHAVLALPICVYDLKAVAASFQTQVQQKLNLTVAREAVINFILSPHSSRTRFYASCGRRGCRISSGILQYFKPPDLRYAGQLWRDRQNRFYWNQRVSVPDSAHGRCAQFPSVKLARDPVCPEGNFLVC